MKHLCLTILCSLMIACTQHEVTDNQATTQMKDLSPYDINIKQQWDNLLLSELRHTQPEQYKQQVRELIKIVEKMQNQQEKERLLLQIYREIDLKQAYDYHEQLLQKYKTADRYMMRCILQEQLGYSQNDIQNCYKALLSQFNNELKNELKNIKKSDTTYAISWLGYFELLHKSGDNTAKNQATKFIETLPEEEKITYQNNIDLNFK